MLKIQGLDKTAYLDQGHLLNICLDQTERKRDLFYKIEIYSSHDFSSQKLGKKYTHKQVLQVPSVPSGGTPSSPFFYKNPQFLIMVD
jgi:hypothetical protein